ncbi:unnamed protein product [Brassica oleracea]
MEEDETGFGSESLHLFPKNHRQSSPASNFTVKLFNVNS